MSKEILWYHIQIGIIGGSGFYQMPELENPKEKLVNTEFGEPTDKLVVGTIHGVPVVVLSRYVCKVLLAIVC